MDNIINFISDKFDQEDFKIIIMMEKAVLNGVLQKDIDHIVNGLKLRHWEKATKLEKKSPTCFDIYSVTSIQLRDFFRKPGCYEYPPDPRKNTPGLFGFFLLLSSSINGKVNIIFHGGHSTKID